MTARAKWDGQAIHHDGDRWVFTDTGDPIPEPCLCQMCGLPFKVDVMVPDDVWERIKPAGKPPGAGLLCGQCILARIETQHTHGVWRLAPVPDSKFEI